MEQGQFLRLGPSTALAATHFSTLSFTSLSRHPSRDIHRLLRNPPPAASSFLLSQNPDLKRDRFHPQAPQEGPRAQPPRVTQHSLPWPGPPAPAAAGPGVPLGQPRKPVRPPGRPSQRHRPPRRVAQPPTAPSGMEGGKGCVRLKAQTGGKPCSAPHTQRGREGRAAAARGLGERGRAHGRFSEPRKTHGEVAVLTARLIDSQKRHRGRVGTGVPEVMRIQLRFRLTEKKDK